MFTFATLVLGVVGGVIPIVEWRAEMVTDITQRKPIVVTNLLPNEDLEIQNLSDAMAVVAHGAYRIGITFVYRRRSGGRARLLVSAVGDT